VCDDAAFTLFSEMPLSVIHPSEILLLLPSDGEKAKRLQRLILGIYVEHRQLDDEMLQTSLGCLLADSAVSAKTKTLSSSPEQLAFRSFLQRYRSYNVEKLQERISSEEFPVVACLLFRALNCHEKALQLLCK
jgi:hypothetical protein